MTKPPFQIVLLWLAMFAARGRALVLSLMVDRGPAGSHSGAQRYSDPRAGMCVSATRNSSSRHIPGVVLGRLGLLLAPEPANSPAPAAPARHRHAGGWVPGPRGKADLAEAYWVRKNLNFPALAGIGGYPPFTASNAAGAWPSHAIRWEGYHVLHRIRCALRCYSQGKLPREFRPFLIHRRPIR